MDGVRLPAMAALGDQKTADAFATSWNNLPEGSVYTQEQFEDWMAPLTREDITGKRVLELGCGNGSLMVHLLEWQPAFLEGVDLGDSVFSAQKNLARFEHSRWRVSQGDLTSFTSSGFDISYCIGVLHHLENPYAGFTSLLQNTSPGGHFHAWVYAREGNGLVVYFVDPLRRVASRLPWWCTKYALATPLAIPFYLYAKLLAAMQRISFFQHFPLFEYCLWISRREFAFFRHVAFDQLVTPRTRYIPRAAIERWLSDTPGIEPGSTYILQRNGNSWKFGGCRSRA